MGKEECPLCFSGDQQQKLNLSDFNYTKQVEGQIRLREREREDQFVKRSGIENVALPRKSYKGYCQEIEEL